ncbi:MAG: hypothetical protein CMO80_13000 [Verrucomicrobiales bacterium]|nr:hypothetical protein [Verrucomicrobiales bacterium]|tara:strand:+ start:371 stop:2041 length:1671 start_codon:yes stop_codon:yes gene_type:complete
MTPPLSNLLQPVIRRYRAWQKWRGLSICWLLTAFAASAVHSLKKHGWQEPEWAFMAILILAALTGFIIWLGCRKISPDRRWISRQIEEEHPELNSKLMAAVEQRPDETGQYSYLQQRVISEAVRHAIQTGWSENLHSRQVVWARGFHWAALIIMIASLLHLRLPTAFAGVLPGDPAYETVATDIKVDPGDTRVEKGRSLVITARFSGPTPVNAHLVVSGDGEKAKIVPMVKAMNDPIFGTTIPEVDGPFRYHVVYEDKQSDEYQVTVFEFPRLEQSNIEINFPEYTGLDKQRTENTRRATAVVRSHIDVELELNKPVNSARLVAANRKLILKTDGTKAVANLKDFELIRSEIFDLQLIDDEGRTNKFDERFVFVALPNRPPEIRFKSPRGDQRVTALQEVLFEAEGWDDYGLTKFGFGYRVAGRDTVDHLMVTNAPAKDKRSFAKDISLEEVGLKPDNLMSYYLWAEDIGPNGKPRRVESDIYFAEIRPFDETFRENQGAGGGQQQNRQQQQGTPSEQLAELVKNITSATWKLRRMDYEEPARPTSTEPKEPKEQP